MAQGYVVYTADKVNKRKQRMKLVKIILLILLLFLMCIFIVLSFAYQGGGFTVTLDPNFHTKSGIAIYIDDVLAKNQRQLYAEELTFMDNISGSWLPTNYSELTGGSHNGDNYIAYTFYIDNQGEETQSYWYSVYIDDVIKNVDEAIRIMIVLNDEKTIYAKADSQTGNPEEGTTAFYSKDRPVLGNRTNFTPGTKDKMTIFIWLEGDDPECKDNILGGEIKLHMEITEEHIEVVDGKEVVSTDDENVTKYEGTNNTENDDVTKTEENENTEKENTETSETENKESEVTKTGEEDTSTE